MRRREAGGGLIGACLVACVTAGLVVVATTRGMGLNPDATLYLSAGENLGAGRGLVGFDGAPMTMFAPALAAVVAVGHVLGVDPDTSVRLCNIAAAAVTVLLAHVLLRRHVRSAALAMVVLVGLGISTMLIDLSDRALSDIAFVAVSLGFILAMERVVRVGSTVLDLAMAVFVVWLGFGVRYAGLAMIPIGASTILVSTGRVRHAARRAVGFLLGSVAFPAIWMVRNLAADGHLMADRSTSINPVGSVVTRFVAVVGSWIDGGAATYGRAGVAGIAGLTSLAVVALVLRRRGVDLVWVARSRGLVPLVAFVLGYSSYIVVVEVAVAIDPLDQRLLAPIFVPLVILVAVVFDGLPSVVSSRYSDRVALAGLVLVAAWGVGQAAATTTSVRSAAAEGLGYRLQSWQESDVGEALREVPDGSVVFSNDPYRVWSVAPASTPRPVPPGWSGTSPDLPTLLPSATESACLPTYLALFTDDLGVEALPRPAPARLVAQDEHGGLYVLESAPTEHCG